MESTSTKTVNYTDAQIAQAIEMYQEVGNDGLDQIADTIGKSVRSVRSKTR